MKLGVRATVDYPFKRLLGDPAHEPITRHFLNAILCDSPQIKTVDYLNPIVLPPATDGKLTVLDLLTLDEVHESFVAPIFQRAAEVLRMITNNSLEQALYEARLQVERDEASRLRDAREEGEQQGEQRGEPRGEARGERRGVQRGEARGVLYGQIQLLQRLLGLPVSTLDELRAKSDAECDRLCESFERQLVARPGGNSTLESS